MCCNDLFIIYLGAKNEEKCLTHVGKSAGSHSWKIHVLHSYVFMKCTSKNKIFCVVLMLIEHLCIFNNNNKKQEHVYVLAWVKTKINQPTMATFLKLEMLVVLIWNWNGSQLNNIKFGYFHEL